MKLQLVLGNNDLFIWPQPDNVLISFEWLSGAQPNSNLLWVQDGKFWSHHWNTALYSYVVEAAYIFLQRIVSTAAPT